MDDVRQLLGLAERGIISPNSFLKACGNAMGEAQTKTPAAPRARKRRRMEAVSAPVTPACATNPSVAEPAFASVSAAESEKTQSEKSEKSEKKQSTLAKFGVRKKVKLTSGEVVEQHLPHFIDDSGLLDPVIPCIWCEKMFKTPQALSSHQMHAHSVAHKAAKLNGSQPMEQSESDIPLAIVNAVMLMTLRVEHEAGRWAGATKLNPKTGQREPYDGRKKSSGGAAHRNSIPLLTRKKAILLADQFREAGFPDAQQAAADACCISPSSLCRYMKTDARQKIMEACKSRAEARKVQSKRKWVDPIAKATEATLADFKTQRARGVRVGPRWLRATILRHVAKFYPDRAKHFKACSNFLSRWRKRNNISIRRRTNVKKKAVGEYVEGLRVMHQQFKSFVSECAGQMWHQDLTGEGRWRLLDRFSIDQVGNHFLHGADLPILRCPWIGSSPAPRHMKLVEPTSSKSSRIRMQTRSDLRHYKW